MGYQDSVTDTGLSEAYLDEENKQSVLRYASSAARTADAALTAALREGMVSYLVDSNTLQVYSGSGWAVIGPVHGVLPAWTPVVVQSNTPAITVNRAAYSRLGRMIFFDAVVTLTAAGTAANPITISLPVAAAYGSVFAQFGNGLVFDTSLSATWPGILRWATSTTVKINNANSGTEGAYLGAAGFTAALAANDIISIQGSYEAAADA